MRADYNYLVSRYGLKKVVSLGKGFTQDQNGTEIVDSSLPTINANIDLYLEDAYQMLIHKLSGCYDICEIQENLSNGTNYPMFKIWHAELTLKLAEYRRGDCDECKDDCDKILGSVCSGVLVDDSCNVQQQEPLLCIEEKESCIPEICKDCGCTECGCCTDTEGII